MNPTSCIVDMGKEALAAPGGRSGAEISSESVTLIDGLRGFVSSSFELATIELWFLALVATIVSDEQAESCLLVVIMVRTGLSGIF